MKMILTGVLHNMVICVITIIFVCCGLRSLSEIYYIYSLMIVGLLIMLHKYGIFRVCFSFVFVYSLHLTYSYD